MNETWRKVEGWPYEVSDHGRVRNAAGQVLRRRSGRRYPRAILCNAGEQREVELARLVLETFVRPALPGEEAAHKNYDPRDCHLTNLEWLAVSENRQRRRYPAGQRHRRAVLTSDRVDFIRDLNDPTQDRKLATQFNVSRESVRDARLYKTWVRQT